MQVIAIISFYKTEDKKISNKPRDYIVYAPQRHNSVGTNQHRRANCARQMVKGLKV